MLFRSSRIYSPDHLDMEAKLNLILKKPQNLKLRANGLKSKSNDKTLENHETRTKNHKDRRRDESIRKLGLMKMTKSVKLR